MHAEKGVPFYECHIAASLQVCEGRDVKGLYAKARAGEIKNFTGISDPYEPPANPELKIETGEKSVDACAAEVIDVMLQNGILNKEATQRSVNSLVKDMTIAEKAEFEQLEVLDIELEQAEYL